MNKKKQLANKKHRKNKLRVKNLLRESLKLAKPKRVITQKDDSKIVKEVVEVSKTAKKAPAKKKVAAKKAPAKKKVAAKKAPAKKKAAAKKTSAKSS